MASLATEALRPIALIRKAAGRLGATDWRPGGTFGRPEQHSERTSRCVSEGAEGGTRARAVPRCAGYAETGSAAAKMLT